MQHQVAKYVTGQIQLKKSFDTLHGKEKLVLGGIIFSSFSELQSRKNLVYLSW